MKQDIGFSCLNHPKDRPIQSPLPQRNFSKGDYLAINRLTSADA
jgi:hypothetical protein